MARNFLIKITIVMMFHELLSKTPTRYTFDIQHLKQCPEPQYKNVESPITNNRIYKLNRTARGFNLDVTIKRPFDEDVGMKIDLAVWSYAGWTPVPYIPLQNDFCNRFKTIFGKWELSILSNLGVEHPEQCPIPPGRYSLKNYTFDMAPTTKLIFFKGRFKVRTLIMSVTTKVLVMCIEAMVNVEEEMRF